MEPAEHALRRTSSDYEGPTTQGLGEGPKKCVGNLLSWY